MNISRRKLALSASALAAVGAVAALIAGVTFGLFTSSVAETNHFVAGTVTLTGNATGACDIANPPTNDVKPGDSGTCTFVTTYSGNPAYEALDILIATKAMPVANNAGGTNLYNPGVGGLTISVADNQTAQTNYTIPGSTAAVTCPAPYNVGGWTCYQLTNELLQASGISVSADTFTVSWSLPSGTGNAYQGGSADVLLTAHAVQQKNNTIACSGQTAPYTAGATCTAGAGFSW